jgi:uncharacterized membrane protein YphA (DoxX/SURF4 family)/peroxiredoxin
MKYLVGFSRVFVGILFIISGFIKLNDPVGFSFKLEEYFSSSVLDLPFFEPHALTISIIVVIFEVLVGVMLLLGYCRKFTVWSLLLMIIGFTFLTFYSAYYNKVTDCGCFGDAIKLTPWESFTKDIILLVLIVILFIGRKYITPWFSGNIRKVLTALTLALCGVYVVHVLNHLPEIDFRPYKIGADIEDGMNVPPGAPQPIIEYTWKFKTADGIKEIVTNGDYPKVDGEFIGAETKEIQKGYEPPVHDFTIEQEGDDFALAMLNEPKLVMVIAYDLRKTNHKFYNEIKKVTDKAIKNGYKVIGMSASNKEQSSNLIRQYGLGFEFYFTDETTLKTIVRSNPGVLVLEEGTIMQKVHSNDLDKLIFEEPENGVYFDLNLKKSLDSIMVLDQKFRSTGSHDDWSKQIAIDSSNLIFIEKVIAEKGYPGKSMVGSKTGETAWYVIQHSNKIDSYIDQIKVAAETGELPFRLYAMMLDRHLMEKGEPQIYGTQGSSYFMNTPNEISFIWPIKNPDSVNILRKDIFGSTVEEYSKRLFGEDFEYKKYTTEEVEKIIKGN